MDLSSQQQAALDSIERWLPSAKSGDGPQVFRLFGYAGTGKTTIARQVERFAGIVQFGAFTGKAALVLRNKGCANASTIHSMIYRSHDKSVEERDSLKAELEIAKADPTKADEVRRLQQNIAEMNEALQQPSFTLNPNAFTRKWDEEAHEYYSITPPTLIAIDECSMVDKYLGQDLLSFKIPVLVIGDPAQLPPVAGGGFFTGSKEDPVEPDAMLTEIHRQAEGNPVLQIATRCRTSGMPQLGAYGESRIVERKDLTRDEWLAADQILAGKNVTRNAINRRVRQLRGFDGFLPNVGERLVCLRNNHPKGLLNGSMWEVTEVDAQPDNERHFDMHLRSLDDANAEPVYTRAHKKPFIGQEFEDYRERGMADEFDYGYCITTHKAQGSEWGSVIYVDEWPGQDRKRHQYTGVTRASQRITVVKW